MEPSYLDYIDIKGILESLHFIYIFTVLLAMEATKKIVLPKVRKGSQEIATAIVSILVALVFYYFEVDEDYSLNHNKPYAFKMFISFTAAVGMYDFIYKPFAKLFKKDTPQNPKPPVK